jgi:GNAT superfamily N-acetyltransferase
MESQPHPAVVIRTAATADLPLVLPLLALLDRPGTPPMERDEAANLLARMATYPDYRLFIAELNGEAVGTYSLLIMDNLGHRGNPIGIVECVSVAEDRRGQGIGKQLMHHAMGECRAKGCYKLALSSNVARTDAHAFYDSLGFKRHGISFVVEF